MTALDESANTTRTKVRIHQWAVLFKVDRRDTYVTKFVIRGLSRKCPGPAVPESLLLRPDWDWDSEFRKYRKCGCAAVRCGAQ